MLYELSWKICIRAVEIRTNDNTVRGHIKNQLIVGSPLLAEDKLDFVAKKVETISISQRQLAKQFYKKECEDNGRLLVLPDKDISEIVIEDVDASS